MLGLDRDFWMSLGILLVVTFILVIMILSWGWGGL